MNKIYINLVPIVVGGGLQNAINFLLNLDKTKLSRKEVVVVVRDNENLVNICRERGFDYIVVENTFMARLQYEMLFFRNSKNAVIFTLFGTKPILSWGTKTITGCAYSNLFYPEIDFWGYLPPVKKAVKKLKDTYRYLNVKSSDVVIFETELLSKKAVKDFGFSKDDTYTVKMAVSSMVNKCEDFIDFNIDKSKFNILYLGSAHPNKRQHLLPKIVKSMVDSGMKDFRYILTMDTKNSYAKEVLSLVSEMNLEDYIVNIGPVDNHKVASLIEQSDAMVNIAKLESFSNNFVEAWQMEKVLFVTDDEWARDSCGSAAVYLDVENEESLPVKIKKVMEDKSFYESITNEGIKQLNSYPTPKEKISQFVEIINKYSEENKK